MSKQYALTTAILAETVAEHRNEIRRCEHFLSNMEDTTKEYESLLSYIDELKEFTEPLAKELTDVYKNLDTTKIGGVIPCETTRLFSRTMPIYVTRSLKTIYMNSWDARVEEMYRLCFSLWSRELSKVDAFKQDVADTIDTYMTNKERTNLKRRAVERAYAKEQKETVLKEHTYRIIDGVRVEVIPYFTQEKTRYGKALEATEYDKRKQEVANPSDVESLGGECNLAMIELYRAELVVDAYTLHAHRRYIYRKINNAITAEKRKAARVQSLEFETENGVQFKDINAMLASVEKSAVWDTVKKGLELSLNNHKRLAKNTADILTVFELKYRYGFAVREIAERIGKAPTQTQRYVKYIEDKLNTAEMHELLHALVEA